MCIRDRYITDTEEKISEKAKNDSRLKLYPEKTILIAMYGQGATRGRVGILAIPATTNQACAAISCSPQILPEFLFHTLKTGYEYIRGLGRGGNQPNLNSKLVKSIPIICPALDRQYEFLEQIELIRDLKNKILGNIETALFASLQQRAFRGEL